MITVSMNFASVEQMQAAFAALAANNSAPAPAATPVTVQVQAAAAIEKAAKVEAPKAPKQPKAEKPAEPLADTQPAAAPAVTTEPTAPATTATESPSERSLTLEEVRAKLVAISQGGKGPQVQALIAATGAKNLTAVDPSKYQELLEKAAAL